jgi:hypothetical protein
MTRRNIVPLAILAVLAVLTVVFAALAATAAPDSSTLVVQNAAGETFGYPDGASSFSMHLISSVSTGPGGGGVSQVRLVNFNGPDRIAVYQTGAQLRLLAVLTQQSAISCVLNAYAAMVGGTTPWAGTGTPSLYRRTETLAAYSSRVPHQSGTLCVPQPALVSGSVSELATVRSGYLVSLQLYIAVPTQTLRGTTITGGVEGEALRLLQINGTSVGSL